MVVVVVVMGRVVMGRVMLVGMLMMGEGRMLAVALVVNNVGVIGAKIIAAGSGAGASGRLRVQSQGGRVPSRSLTRAPCVHHVAPLVPVALTIIAVRRRLGLGLRLGPRQHRRAEPVTVHGDDGTRRSSRCWLDRLVHGKIRCGAVPDRPIRGGTVSVVSNNPAAHTRV